MVERRPPRRFYVLTSEGQDLLRALVAVVPSGSPAGMLFPLRRRQTLERAWHAAKMELGAPELVLDWAEDYAKIPASLERLNAAAADLPRDHPVRPLLLRATVVIDQWLARWPATTDPRAEDPDPRSVWNDQISLELQEIWGEVQDVFSAG